MAPKPNDGHPYKRKAEGDLRQRWRPCNDRGRDYNMQLQAKEHQQLLAATKN